MLIHTYSYAHIYILTHKHIHTHAHIYIPYRAITVADLTGGGLGDAGGYIGAGFAVILLFALVGAAAYESFKE